MADPAPAQPMEEILASIKRIIAEDAPVRPAPVVADADEPLDPGEPIGQKVAPAGEEVLLSAASQAASRQALAALSAISIDPSADANTLDGLVRELLRPMLKGWLDANLPGIVERMVAREIQRLGVR